MDRRYRILGGKTAAGYCLLISAEVAGRRVVVALLGGKTSQARFDDFARLIAWLAAESPEPSAPAAR